MKPTATMLFLLVACTPVQASRARQTADMLCAGVAANFHLAKGDALSERIALACLDRLDRNEAIEDALLASMAGARPALVVEVAGQP